MGSSGNQVVALGPRAEGTGRLVFGGFSYGEQPGASGGGSLAILDLQLLAYGQTALALEDVQLAARDAAPAPLHSVAEGYVRALGRIYLPLVMREYW